MSRTLTLSLAAALATTLAWSSLAPAQDAPKPTDDALDSLLEKLDDSKPGDGKPESPDPGKPAAENRERNAPEGSGSAPAGAAKPSGTPAGKGEGEVDSKDQALDNLLEKLGEAEDAPSPDDRPKSGGGKPDDEPMPLKPRPDEPMLDEPTGKAKDLDEHLGELMGRRTRKKDQEGEGSGPLADVIKQMREVERRLDETDTGEKTRQKQTEIVQRLDQLIDQLRVSSGKSQGKKKLQLAIRPGQRAGSQSGSTPGTNSGQAPNQKPLKPTEKRALVNGKDEWGHLPDALRQELENVMKEAPLSSKEDLIRRYYLSVSKKSLSREE